MCGVVAMLSGGRPISEQHLGRAVASLYHRGPDGQGTWIAPHRRAGLGHRRLGIIDLETGSQPIANEDGQVLIAVNGEFYGYEETRRNLELAGHRFRTASDSEIALHLYEDHGTDCVGHLRGEFALVIWDERHRRLLAFRDRYGVKPLFYSLHDGNLVVASEMKALFAAGVPAAWDPESAYFGMALRGAGRTPFKGVYAVPPGHYLVAEGGSLRVVQYWDIDYPAANEERAALSDADYIESFRSKLDEAVRLRLRADVPVACYLSGGIDSCAILGLAARHRSDPIRAFTLRFDHEDYDEGKIAEEMAALAGAEYTALAVGQDDLADNFSDAVFHSEGVCANAHGIAKYLLSRAVRDAGFKVVLTGEGADEVMAGYPHFRQDLLTQQAGELGAAETARLMAALGEANKVSRGLLFAEEEGVGSSLMQQALGFTPAWLKPQFSRVEFMRRIYSDPFLARFEERDSAELLLGGLDIPRRLRGREPLCQALYLWAKSMLPNYILATLGDRMEMAHSVEGRLPFLDHKLAEFLQQTPSRLLIRGMTEKFILREASRDVISDRVYRRQKHPFLSPPATAGANPRFLEIIRDSLCSDAVASIPFFDAAKVRHVADRLPRLSPAELQAIDRQLLITTSTILLHQRLGVAG